MRTEANGPNHRGHARVEDRIRGAKDTGLANFPFHDFCANAAWLELVLSAQDLTAWTKLLCLEGELAAAEPKRLRFARAACCPRFIRLTDQPPRLRISGSKAP
jgi:hypothetical protein